MNIYQFIGVCFSRLPDGTYGMHSTSDVFSAKDETAALRKAEQILYEDYPPIQGYFNFTLRTIEVPLDYIKTLVEDVEKSNE
jgi:hypothetical protein